MGAPNPLLKSFSGEGTLWDSSLSVPLMLWDTPVVCTPPLPLSQLGFGKRGLLEKGSFQKSSFSRDSREFRDSRVSREPPHSGKERRFRPFSRDSRESRDFRDSRDFSSEKTPFVMTPFSGPPHALGYACSLYTPTSPLPTPDFFRGFSRFVPFLFVLGVRGRGGFRKGCRCNSCLLSR